MIRHDLGWHQGWYDRYFLLQSHSTCISHPMFSRLRQSHIFATMFLTTFAFDLHKDMAKNKPINPLTNPDQPLRLYIWRCVWIFLFPPFFNYQIFYVKGFQTQIGFLAITILVSMPCHSKSHLKQNKLFLPPAKVKTAEILSPEFDAQEQENTSKGVTRATASPLNISILWMDFTISHQFDLIMIDDRFTMVLFEPVF